MRHLIMALVAAGVTILSTAPAQAEFFNSGGSEQITFDTLAFAEVSNGTDVRFFNITVLDDMDMILETIDILDPCALPGSSNHI